MAKKKAKSISTSQLRASIEKAVKAEKGIKLQAPVHLLPGVIIGMILEDADLEQATAVADRIRKNVEKPLGGVKLDPAVLILGKRITVGFIDPSRTPVFIDQ